MQAALTARQSRLAVRLPDGARLGIEKGGSGSGEGAASFVRGDRELARALVALFDDTGLKVCVVFPGAGEMRAAVKSFGPLAECVFDCWEDGGGEKKKGKKKGGGVKASGAGAGFGGAGVGMDRDGGGSGHVAGEVMMSGGIDVYIVVGPKQSQMARLRQLAGRFGDEVLVIGANLRVEDMKGLPSNVEEFVQSEFEDVYYWGVNPSPRWTGGILFRAYPNDWVVGRATPIGTLQRLLETAVRPSVDDVTLCLKAEADKPTTGVLNKVVSFLEKKP